MKLKKFLILFLVLFGSSLYAKQYKLQFPIQTVASSKNITQYFLFENDYTLLRKINSLRKEYKDAVVLLVDSLHEKENSNKIVSNKKEDKE